MRSAIKKITIINLSIDSVKCSKLQKLLESSIGKKVVFLKHPTGRLVDDKYIVLLKSIFLKNKVTHKVLILNYISSMSRKLIMHNESKLVSAGNNAQTFNS